jgi:glucose-induced degradation protein 8
MKVRNLIITGKIDEAINEINDINSEILENNPSIHFELQKQKLIEIIKQNKVEEALQFAQNKLFPITQNNVNKIIKILKSCVIFYL